MRSLNHCILWEGGWKVNRKMVRIVTLYVVCSLMRHRNKRVRNISSGAQKTSNVLRNMLTNLVAHGQIVTTQKRAQVLKSIANNFFAGLVKLYKTRPEADARREAIREVKSIIYTEVDGKRIIDELLPRYIDRADTRSYVMDLKLGPRPGDAAEKVLIRLIA